MKAVVAGGIATYPVGGVVWDYGQYALGLERLGFEVYYLEDTGLVAYDAATTRVQRGSDLRCWVSRSDRWPTSRHRSTDRWHVRTADGRTYGMEPASLAERHRRGRPVPQRLGLVPTPERVHALPAQGADRHRPRLEPLRQLPPVGRQPGLAGNLRLPGATTTSSPTPSGSGSANCALPTLGLSLAADPAAGRPRLLAAEAAGGARGRRS